MNIGLFQLENLVHSQVRFAMLDLRESASPLPKELEVLFSHAVKPGAKNAEKYIQENLMNLEAPIILLSQDGRVAEDLRVKLETAGYKNIYVIEGGVEGLLSEL